MAKRPAEPGRRPRVEILCCSFCNKDQNDVKKLIAGPAVFICDECVEVCNEIIAEDAPIGAAEATRRRPARMSVTLAGPLDASAHANAEAWLSGESSGTPDRMIDPFLAGFLLSSARDAIVDLSMACEGIVAELDGAVAVGPNVPVALRARVSRLARTARELGLVTASGSFFASRR
jgi:hypothetical protein